MAKNWTDTSIPTLTSPSAGMLLLAADSGASKTISVEDLILKQPLTGLTIPAASAIVATDTVLEACGKAQAQINGSVLKTGSTMTGALTVVLPVITALEPVLTLTNEWNNGAVVFHAAVIDVVNTASASGSSLLDLRIGGTSKFKFREDNLLELVSGGGLVVEGSTGSKLSLQNGVVTIKSASGSEFMAAVLSSSIRIGFVGTTGIGWGSGGSASSLLGTAIYRDNADGILAVISQMDPTDPQEVRVYQTGDTPGGTQTDFERFYIKTGQSIGSGTGTVIGTEFGGISVIADAMFAIDVAGSDFTITTSHGLELETSTAGIRLPRNLVLGGGVSPVDLRLLEGSGGGTNFTGFKAPATLAADVVYTMPSADGASGEALTTNGSKTLSWSAGGGGGGSGPERLYTNLVDAGNVSTSETDLHSYTIAGGKLSSNGDYVEIQMAFSFANTDSDQQARIRYDSTIIFDSQDDVFFSNNAGSFNDFESARMMVTVCIYRLSATTQRITVQAVGTDGANFICLAGTDIVDTTKTLANALIIKGTGLSDQFSSEIVQHSTRITYHAV